MDARTGRLLLGAGSGVAKLMWASARPVRAVTSTVLQGGVAVVTLVAPRTSAALVREGRRERVRLLRRWNGLLEVLVGEVLDAFLRSIDLTGLVRDQVDVDALAGGLDVDAVVAGVDLDAVVRRLDLDAIVARVDLDRVVAGVDLDAVVARVDLDAAVRRVDLDAAVRRVDLDAVVRRVDIEPVLAELDVDGVAARIDLDAVIARLDLVGIARTVIDELNLPEIIRSSTGALTSDTVRAVRTEAMTADGVVSGAVDRLLRRGGAAQPPVPP
ncbi:hypothetical protein PSU4_01160 [Pseudonocardia sulfidoxydans NBRC 16205]|uniref:Uncharacterized protein n=1 Tax=Pseudonocardia sulfidoxydans NBRC 16205 TaxID=1223511 RepID=A0A511D8P9_9PSEU|nr:hypothetical protein [Pseudonocardia sulfidoxydans]GEL21162.1 hypothetical protein PSU4_01160 [Pseudonocardia sulfidoxydans NBRC 16205]